MDRSDDDRARLLRSLSFERAGDAAGDETERSTSWQMAGAVGVAGIALGAIFMALFGPSENDIAPMDRPADGAARADGQPVTSEAGDRGLVASGYVVARKEATVAAEVTGRIAEIRIEEGQRVTRGQILAVLDRSVISADAATALARVASSRSTVVALEAELAEARTVLERAEALDSRGFITKAELGQKRALVESLAARVQSARADTVAATESRESVLRRVDQYYVRAPFSGVVVDTNAQVGEMISPISAGGGFTRTGICTVVDMDSLEIEVDVNEQYIERVREGQSVEVTFDAYPSLTAQAYVIAIVPALDRARSTFRVRIGFREMDDRFIPNLSVKVRFMADSGNRGPDSNGEQ